MWDEAISSIELEAELDLAVSRLRRAIREYQGLVATRGWREVMCARADHLLGLMREARSTVASIEEELGWAEGTVELPEGPDLS